jgi:hypothetical protein
MNSTPYVRDGRVVTREEFDRTVRHHRSRRLRRNRVKRHIAQGYSESTPGKSISLSVHPNQCAMMNEALKAHGVQGVHYDPSKKHNCVITSRRARARAMKVIGPMLGLGRVHDEDGGYGDG